MSEYAGPIWTVNFNRVKARKLVKSNNKVSLLFSNMSFKCPYKQSSLYNKFSQMKS